MIGCKFLVGKWSYNYPGGGGSDKREFTIVHIG